MTPRILEPSGIITLCPGGRMDFYCTTNNTVHHWSIKISSSTGTDQRATDISDIGPGRNLTISKKIFQVTRNSTYQSLPLITTLTAVNLTADLNGTKVQCTDVSRDNSTNTATLHIIIPNNGKLMIISVILLCTL